MFVLTGIGITVITRCSERLCVEISRIFLCNPVSANQEFGRTTLKKGRNSKHCFGL